MGDRYVVSDDNKKILFIDATNLYGHSMSQTLPYDEIKIERKVCSEDLLNTPDDNDIGYFLQVDPDNTKEKKSIFHRVHKIKNVIKIFLVII